MTFTPRLLATDLKSRLGCLPLNSNLYEESSVPDPQDDTLLWPSEKVEVHRAPEHEKNEFLEDLARGDMETSAETSGKNFRIFCNNFLILL